MEPTRRALVVAAAGAAAGLAGCVAESETATERDDRTTEIVDVTLETNVDVDRSLEDDPTVSYDGDRGVIEVLGRYSIGNACYDVAFPDPVYDEEADELRIRLSRSHDGSDECEDIDQEISYRVVVAIDGTPPGVVTASEARGGEAVVEIT